MIPINEYVFKTETEAYYVLSIIMVYGWISKYEYCVLTDQRIPDNKRYQYLKESACDRDDIVGLLGSGWRIKTREGS